MLRYWILPNEETSSRERSGGESVNFRQHVGKVSALSA